VYTGDSEPTFRRYIVPPSLGSTSKLSTKPAGNRHKEGFCFHLSTWRYVPEDSSVHNHCSENFKFCVIKHNFLLKTFSSPSDLVLLVLHLCNVNSLSSFHLSVDSINVKFVVYNRKFSQGRHCCNC
jgi:hypothetical protein